LSPLRLAVLGAALMLPATSARAEATAAPTLVVEHCPDLDEARLRELLTIELATVVQPFGAAPLELHLVCSGPRVVMDLSDGALGRSWRAEVDLTATPEATRLRSLVLAVTEQWALQRAEAANRAAAAERPVAPALASPPPPDASTNATVVEHARPSPPAAEPWRLFAKGSLRSAGHPGLWLGGGGVGAERALSRHLGLALDLVAERGGVDVPIATVAMRDLVATAGLVVGTDAGRWSFAAVPAFSVGLAALTATPRVADARGATLDAAWAGPVVEARVRRAVGRAGYAVAEAGVGVTTRRVTGLVDMQSTLFELRGPWLQLGLGAGLVF
jgi:hypothetical protein